MDDEQLINKIQSGREMIQDYLDQQNYAVVPTLTVKLSTYNNMLNDKFAIACSSSSEANTLLVNKEAERYEELVKDKVKNKMSDTGIKNMVSKTVAKEKAAAQEAIEYREMLRSIVRETSQHISNIKWLINFKVDESKGAGL